MKGFVILLLGVIFAALITNSVPSIAADDSGSNSADSEDADKLNIVPTESPKYKIYLDVVVRNAHGELVSVTDTMPCQFGRNCSTYMPHEVTDYAFNTLLGKKEIIIIDNIKYEKVQFSTISDNQWLFDVYDRELTGIWEVEICGEPIKKYGSDCTNVFWSRTSVVYQEMGDVTTVYWTILREMN